ncbi:Putative flippase GtrA (transmembrane translocase of bactoprenol-linked glucose) [Amycolatopsis marina]|uniref:Flippase GtrA (Transmembrane translocase of bactoprenol-linked glucose) n=1 Tax=Amycolatopsis marina TaxID=490629 RepID=A0A1I1BUA4_9PSEU|nr:Putative flippase GtrA (transmembrane translocase of bactoprenol-linked glucose) [Amycolatopsis marina]
MTRGDFLRQAGWYLSIGAVTTLVQGLLFVVLRTPCDASCSNLVATGLTTVANTEFHRLVTFAGAPNRKLRRYLQTLVSAVFYILHGSVALAVLDTVKGSYGIVTEALVVVLASALGGTIRFIVLRQWVFRSKQDGHT